MHKDIQRGLYGLALATGIFILGTSEASATETTGSDSITGGTQITPVITAPIAVEDNAITVIGDPATGSQDTNDNSSTTPSATGTAPVTNGENSIAGGTQITPVITAPIGVEDNAITLIGDPNTGSTDNGTTPMTGATGSAPVTDGEGSTAGGTQITPSITAPIAVEDNAVTVIGDPATGSQDTNGNFSTTPSATGSAPATDGENSIAGGTQITPVITTPIAVQDNAITVGGDPSTGSTDNGTTSPSTGDTGTTGTTPLTGGESSIGGGTQIAPVITTPIELEDNAITVIGDPATGSQDTNNSSTTPGATDSAPATNGEDSIAGGTQITPVITVPVAVEDNAVTVIGDPTTGSTDNGTTSLGTTGTAPLTDGESSIGGGTQITPVITVPVAVEDNAVTVIGDPITESTDNGTSGGTPNGTTTPGTTGSAPVTDGEGGAAGGTQITPGTTTPIGVQDNAITIVGDPSTGSNDGGTITPSTAIATPGSTTPVSEDDGLGAEGADAGAGAGAGAGGEGTTGVSAPEGAPTEGSITVGGTVHAHVTAEMASAAVTGDESAAGRDAFEHQVKVSSSTGAATGNTGFGINAAGKAQDSATAHHGAMLAHTGAASTLITGMATALVVIAIALLLAGRQRAALAQP